MPVTEIWLDNGMALSGFWRKPSEFLMIEAIPYALGGLDATVGNPAPSFKNQGGAWPVRLAVKSGARTVKVDVLQPDATAARPVMRIKANPSIGIPSDVTATAGSQTTWQTLSVTINPTADGAFVLELENPDPEKPCWFDNVKIQ
jgi:hypothetical protein